MNTTEFKILQWLLKATFIVPCAIVFCYFLAFLPTNDPDSSHSYWSKFGFVLAVTLALSGYFLQDRQIEKKRWAKSILKLIAVVFGCALISTAISFVQLLQWGR